MLTLQEHIEAESARWAASRTKERPHDEQSVVSSAITITTTADSIFSSPAHLRSKFYTRTLSRRSSTSSFATEFEPDPQQGQQPFVVPRDSNGAPITVYASLEAAVAAQNTRVMMMLAGQGQGAAQNTAQGTGRGGGGEEGGGGGGGGVGTGAGRTEEQPRRLVTPGKLYENEEDDDEIVYE